MPPIDDIAMHCVGKALAVAPKGVKLILLGDLNIRLREPHIQREEGLPMVLADRGLVDMTPQFLPWQWYRGDGCWTRRI